MQNKGATSHQPPATVADLTERELIARIQCALPPAPGWMLVGIGDDAAVVEPERNRVEVLTVDALVEGVHFDRAFVPADAIGYRALAVNLSDLAAMGASPRAALLSLALPAGLSVGDFDAMIHGLARLAAEHRLHLAGGNVTRSPGPLMVDVTAIGTVKRRQALTRGGARPGDDLYVSGTIGAAAAGLAMLRERQKLSTTEDTKDTEGQPDSTWVPTFVSSVSSVVKTCLNRYLYPEPRVRLGVLLSRNRAATACVDLSDGLTDGVRRLVEASGVGAAIDADAVPVHPGARAWFNGAGRDGVAEAMTLGDDYELLLAVRPRTGRRLAEAMRRSGTPLTRIGTCTKDPAILLSRDVDGRRVERALPEAAYHHFR
jgi:thiamine-monophosphate kinase